MKEFATLEAEDVVRVVRNLCKGERRMKGQPMERMIKIKAGLILTLRTF